MLFVVLYFLSICVMPFVRKRRTGSFPTGMFWGIMIGGIVFLCCVAAPIINYYPEMGVWLSIISLALFILIWREDLKIVEKRQTRRFPVAKFFKFLGIMLVPSIVAFPFIFFPYDPVVKILVGFCYFGLPAYYWRMELFSLLKWLGSIFSRTRL